jgi:hypothetical protein
MEKLMKSSGMTFSPNTLTKKAKVGQNLNIKFEASGKTPGKQTKLNSSSL